MQSRNVCPFCYSMMGEDQPAQCDCLLRDYPGSYFGLDKTTRTRIARHHKNMSWIKSRVLLKNAKLRLYSKTKKQ